LKFILNDVIIDDEKFSNDSEDLKEEEDQIGSKF
jgi:hypothetical protein